ncbi:MAG: hypothetical protein LJE69_00175 [Thiohalocapsa sp.]|jgi:hypothetical protein|uniref:hypothetical protein n=1 Tax=Thiohalocapsa sp. TaxID=2497641 RepID=UPI0025F3A713|nr:hypothetical protein [Thiohalocapsa sp.]MCG6939653.1 hypothetical protein [Thiohalocapsa sp.]
MFTQKLTTICQPSLLALAVSGVAHAQYDDPNATNSIAFDLDRSPGIVQAGCLPYAAGSVVVTSQGPVEVMDIAVDGLPKNVVLDVFVIQVPNPPFGLSWYQGDLETDANGHGEEQFIGRFSKETFVVALGVAASPVVHRDPFTDADKNPKTDPVHTYHIGLWFDSPYDASAAGCPDSVTPFNGEHNAGVQVLNTSSFDDLAGPLFQLE